MGVKFFLSRFVQNLPKIIRGGKNRFARKERERIPRSLDESMTKFLGHGSTGKFPLEKLDRN